MIEKGESGGRRPDPKVAGQIYAEMQSFKIKGAMVPKSHILVFLSVIFRIMASK